MQTLQITLRFFLTALFFFAPFAALSQEFNIDDFSKSTVESFPSGWKTYPFQKGKAKKVYKVGEEKGERFIRAEDDQDISIPIFKDFPWSLDMYPVLKWRWRAMKLPQGAQEDSRATNDSACGVYVAFGKTSGVGLKYVWSSTLPVGHVWEKDPGKFYIIVAASGASSAGKWKNQKINVVEDFKKYFKKDPWKDPSGVGIMTDGNATHSPAACDYGEFEITKS